MDINLVNNCLNVNYKIKKENVPNIVRECKI